MMPLCLTPRHCPQRPPTLQERQVSPREARSHAQSPRAEDSGPEWDWTPARERVARSLTCRTPSLALL